MPDSDQNSDSGVSEAEEGVQTLGALKLLGSLKKISKSQNFAKNTK